MTINPAAITALAKGDVENFLVASSPGGIERSEKAGQTDLVKSANMPLELYPNKEAFEKIGFSFGERIDDVFQSAALPTGWTRNATEHAMHSDILDDQGRKRVSVFYKAAYYDRRADASLVERYKMSTVYGDLEGVSGLAKDEIAHVVLDGETELYRTAACKRHDYPASDKLAEEACAWLKERFPQADDPTAYW